MPFIIHSLNQCGFASFKKTVGIISNVAPQYNEKRKQVYLYTCIHKVITVATKIDFHFFMKMGCFAEKKILDLGKG